MFFLFPPQCCWAASSARSCSPSSSWPSVSTGPSGGGSGAGPAGASRECCIPPGIHHPSTASVLPVLPSGTHPPGTAPDPSGSPIRYHHCPRPTGFSRPVPTLPALLRSRPVLLSGPRRPAAAPVSCWGCPEDASVAFHPSLPVLYHMAPSRCGFQQWSGRVLEITPSLSQQTPGAPGAVSAANPSGLERGLEQRALLPNRSVLARLIRHRVLESIPGAWHVTRTEPDWGHCPRSSSTCSVTLRLLFAF